MKPNGIRNPIYGYELSVLDRFRQELSKPRESETKGDLQKELEALLTDYEKLFKMLKKISAISDAQGKVLNQRENDIKNLLDHANQGFLSFGSDLRVHSTHSRECLNIFGRRIGGAKIDELLFRTDANKQQNFHEQLSRLFESGVEQVQGVFAELPERLDLMDKKIDVEYKWISPNDVTSEERVLMLILTDVTEQIETQEKVHYLSTHDILTSLYNRFYLEKVLEAKPFHDQLPLSLLVIDINGLKLANDVFGHRTGDQLLILASRILLQVFNESAIVGRWGGDEFVVLLPNTDEAKCTEWKQRLQAAAASEKIGAVRLSMAVGSSVVMSADDKLSGTFLAAEKNMYKQKLLENKRFRKELIEGVTVELIARGVQDEAHLSRMLDQAIQFTEYLDVARNPNDRKLLHNLVKLHDVGNLALPSHILDKTSPLDDEEWEIVKTHSEIGYRMAQSVGEWELADAILGVHERWDGTGYPYGLARDQIPYYSRLLAILDAYDVMTNDQPYKHAISPEEALQAIKEASGKQFDPKLVEAYLRWTAANVSK